MLFKTKRKKKKHKIKCRDHIKILLYLLLLLLYRVFVYHRHPAIIVVAVCHQFCWFFYSIFSTIDDVIVIVCYINHFILLLLLLLLLFLSYSRMALQTECSVCANARWHENSFFKIRFVIICCCTLVFSSLMLFSFIPSAICRCSVFICYVFL